MVKEILLKDHLGIENYYKEMAFVAETGVLELVKRSVDFKKKNASTRISKEDKYFVEIIWPTKIEDKKVIFGRFFSIIPDAEKRSLIFMSESPQKLKEKDWSNREVIKETIRKAFKNPFPRSNQKFYNDPIPEPKGVEASLPLK